MLTSTPYQRLIYQSYGCKVQIYEYVAIHWISASPGADMVYARMI
jgi:hypothetical protein